MKIFGGGLGVELEGIIFSVEVSSKGLGRCSRLVLPTRAGGYFKSHCSHHGRKDLLESSAGRDEVSRRSVWAEAEQASLDSTSRLAK